MTTNVFCILTDLFAVKDQARTALRAHLERLAREAAPSLALGTYTSDHAFQNLMDDALSQTEEALRGMNAQDDPASAGARYRRASWAVQTVDAIRKAWGERDVHPDILEEI